MWYLQREHARLSYHWQELWRALILLLDFLASKLDSLVTTGGVKQLSEEVSDKTILYRSLTEHDHRRHCW